MPLTRTQKVATAVGVVLALAVIITVLVVVLKKKKKKSSTPASPPKTRQVRIAERRPFNSYSNKTPSTVLKTVAAAAETRIQAELPSSNSVTVYPAGVEELHWAASQRKTYSTPVAIVSAPASSACQTLPDTSTVGDIHKDYTLSLRATTDTWGALVIESDADADTLNKAIDTVSNAAKNQTTVNSDDSTPWVMLSTLEPAAPSHADAIASCSKTLPVSA